MEREYDCVLCDLFFPCKHCLKRESSYSKPASQEIEDITWSIRSKDFVFLKAKFIENCVRSFGHFFYIISSRASSPDIKNPTFLL